MKVINMVKIILPENMNHIFEGRYPDGTVFYKDGVQVYKYSLGNLYDLEGNQVVTDTYVLAKTTCPNGYEQVTLDADRLLGIGASYSVEGSDFIKNWTHSHEQTRLNLTSTGGTSGTDVSVAASDASYKYIKYILCKSVFSGGTNE